jgi:hypothetical protein
MIELKYVPDTNELNPHRELEVVIRGITGIIEAMSFYGCNEIKDNTSRQIWPLLGILIKPILYHFFEDGLIKHPVDEDSKDGFIEEPLDLKIKPFIPRKIKSKNEIKAFFDSMEKFCKETGAELIFSREEMQDFEDFFWWLKKK